MAGNIYCFVVLMFVCSRVFAHERVLDSWRTGIIRLTNPRPTTYTVNRIAKYVVRGFEVHAPFVRPLATLHPKIYQEGALSSFIFAHGVFVLQKTTGTSAVGRCRARSCVIELRV